MEEIVFSFHVWGKVLFSQILRKWSVITQFSLKIFFLDFDLRKNIIYLRSFYDVVFLQVN